MPLRTYVALSLLICGGVHATGASAKSAAPIFVTRGTPVSAPRGFDEMCQKDATFCGTVGVPTQPTAAVIPPVAVAPPRPSWVPIGVASFIISAAPYIVEAASHLQADRDPGCIAGVHDRWVAFSSELDGLERATTPVPCQVAAVSSGAPVQVAQAVPAAPPLQTPAPLQPVVARKPSDARAQLAVLKQVNTLVNGRTTQESDRRRFGRDEMWRRSGIGKDAVGDCEDLAIEKRYQLIARGFEPSRVSFAVVFAPSVGLHTVLVARTDKGDMVLDSATPWVRRADKTGYSWVSIQSVSDQRRWEMASIGIGIGIGRDRPAPAAPRLL